MKKLFEALYASEINVQLSWFWDAGYTIKIGDDMNGFHGIIESHDLDKCLYELVKKVKVLYPDSKFVKTFKILDKNNFEEIVEPVMEYLATNFHPHTHIIIESNRAELSEGVRSYVTDKFIPD